MHHVFDNVDPNAPKLPGLLTFTLQETLEMPYQARQASVSVQYNQMSEFDARYAFVRYLGQGSFGQVYSYRARADNRVVAVKESRSSLSDEARLILDTIPKHASIAEINEAFSGVSITSGLFCYRLVMPLYQGGDLFTLTEKADRAKITEAFIWHVFVQMAEGLHFVHTNDVLPVLHCDIKAENTMLDLAPSGALYDNVKIIDFGAATTKVYPHTYIAGTTCNQPPELPTVSFAADIYSLGVVIHFLATSGDSVRPDIPGYLDRMSDVIDFYQMCDPVVQHITSPESEMWRLGHNAAAAATFNSPTPLPEQGYSPLLEYWMRRTLDPTMATRATGLELTTFMVADAKRMIHLQRTWADASGEGPTDSLEYTLPPAGWKANA